MPNYGETLRRRFGLFFLIAAGAMLLLGLTLFSERLRGPSFMIYWLICFVFTGLAMLTALLDLLLVRHRQREEQRDLIVHAIEELESDVKLKKRHPKPAAGRKEE